MKVHVVVWASIVVGCTFATIHSVAISTIQVPSE
jgi:hypothetical protein